VGSSVQRCTSDISATHISREVVRPRDLFSFRTRRKFENGWIATRDWPHGRDEWFELVGHLAFTTPRLYISA